MNFFLRVSGPYHRARKPVKQQFLPVGYLDRKRRRALTGHLPPTDGKPTLPNRTKKRAAPWYPTAPPGWPRRLAELPAGWNGMRLACPDWRSPPYRKAGRNLRRSGLENSPRYSIRKGARRGRRRRRLCPICPKSGKHAPNGHNLTRRGRPVLYPFCTEGRRHEARDDNEGRTVK